MNENWPRVVLRELATDIKDGTHGTHPRVGEGIPLLSAKNVSGRGKVIVSDDEELISEYEYQLITSSFAPQSGDLLITIVGTVGRRAIYDGSKVAFQRSVAFIRSRKEILADYLFHAVGSDDFARQLAQRSNATAQTGLYLGELAKVSVPLPPRPIQRRIAGILSTVDEAIEQTEALIAKYQQIKAGLMHDLFTRGVTPDGHLRPTRVQAPHLYKESPLGWVPKEWKLGCLRDSCELLKDGTHLPPIRVLNGPLLLSVQNMIDGHLQLTNSDTRVPEEFFAQMHTNWLIKPHDVLLAVVGATIGKVCRVPDDFPRFTLQRSVAVLRGRPGFLTNQFLYWFLISPQFKSQLWQRVNQTAQPGIYLDQIAKLNLPVPQSHEQLAISQRFESAADIVEATKADLRKLEAIKHGLMHDLLTGRVRVKVAETASI